MSETDSNPDETFEITIQSDVLENFLSAPEQIINEAKFRFTEDGLALRAVDPANVAMVDMFLQPAAFETYNCGEGVIGVNTDRLGDIIAAPDDGELVSITYNAETKKLNIEAGAMSYKMALIDPASIRQEPDIPDLDLACEVAFSPDQFDEMITTMELVSDHVTFTADDDSFGATSDGDTDDAEVLYDPDQLVKLETSGDVEAIYSLDYMTDVTSGIETDGDITMELGDEFPTKLHWRFANGNGKGLYMIAPRISSD